MVWEGLGISLAGGWGCCVRWEMGGCLWQPHGYQQLEKKKSKLWLMRAFSSRLSGSEVAVLQRPYPPADGGFPPAKFRRLPWRSPRRSSHPRALGAGSRTCSVRTALPFGMQMSLLRAWGAWGHGGEPGSPPCPAPGTASALGEGPQRTRGGPPGCCPCRGGLGGPELAVLNGDEL